MYYYKIENGYMCVPTPRSGYEEITQEEYESHIPPVQEQTDTTVYHLGDYKEENGTMYRALQDIVIGIPVTNTLYWEACDTTSELNRLNNLIKEA